ncbi:glycosyltransferase family 2 protein [Pinibacter aurantiacus]|uniref:Glycosyltransferase family 2 protein n=1 Tax=Pinibacter aurantiacus TaxID=2851599 RepID=A0A9E2S757_9BACT|nr:glycosyltransferase family 2 protein [Pinibacter aurantiacus]MBV4356218.1 glycosyltransferase family 2 protein [Pinibacter aurantiacus]
MHLSVIIVNYNVKFFLEQCLYSLLKAIDNLPSPADAEVIVFDNASSDGSRAFFLNKFQGVQFIWHGENLGFAKANNRALSFARGKYILFLNPDTILSEDALYKSVHFLESQSGGGALGIRMIDGSGNFLPESKRGFPSPAASFYKLSGLIHLFPSSKKIATYYAGHLSEHESNEIDVLSGAYMLVKKEVLDKTGGFDEAFFMYGEDIDLSYRIQKAGYKNFYFADSTIIHFKGESTNQNSARYVRIFYQAMNIFVHKHFNTASSWWYIAFIKVAILLSGVLSFVKRSVASVVKPRPKTKLQTLIVASKHDEENIVSILSSYKTPERKITFENLDSLDNNFEYSLYDEIIIAASSTGVAYKDVITFLQQVPSGVAVKIHSSGSSSIVCSDSKAANGDVLHATV